MDFRGLWHPNNPKFIDLKTAYKIIAEETGTSIEKVEKDTDRDYWLNAEESVSYGLISRVVSKRSELK